jgi:hypothetical protein
MSLLMLSRVNNHTVGPIPIPKDTRKVRAAELCEEPYANIALIAKKKSGKTSVIYHLLQHCVGKHTTVIIFCSTVNKDPGWIAIQKYLRNKHVEYEAYDDLYENNENKLREIIEVLDEEAKERINVDTKPESTHDTIMKIMGGPKDEEPKRKKEKLLAPEYIFIMDDLSHRLHDPAIVELLCRNRHYLCKTIISTQYIHQIALQCRKQIDLYMIFRGLPPEKMKEIAKDADISIPFDQFWKIYRKATEKKHSFLYLATSDQQFRRNFSDKFIIKDPEDDTKKN